MRSRTSSKSPPQGNASNGSPCASEFLRSTSDGLLVPVTNHEIVETSRDSMKVARYHIDIFDIDCPQG